MPAEPDFVAPDPREVDPRAVRRAFGRAASSYDAAAALQREVSGRLAERLDPDTATVLGIAMPPGKAGALEAINHCRHGAGRKADVLSESPGGCRAGDFEEVQTLQVRRIQADDLGNGVAQQHRLGADLAQRLLELLEEVGAGFGCLWHQLLVFKVSQISRYLPQEGSVV